MEQGRSESPPRCYVCMDSVSKEEKLVSPCRCIGSTQLVHQDCISKLVSSGYTMCSICKVPYKIEKNIFAIIGEINDIVFRKVIRWIWSYNLSSLLVYSMFAISQLQKKTRDDDTSQVIYYYPVSCLTVIIANNFKRFDNFSNHSIQLFLLIYSVSINATILFNISGNTNSTALFITLIIFGSVVHTINTDGDNSLSEYCSMLRLYSVFQLIILYIFIEKDVFTSNFSCICASILSSCTYMETNHWDVIQIRKYTRIFGYILLLAIVKFVATSRLTFKECSFIVTNSLYQIINWAYKTYMDNHVADYTS